MSGIHRGAMRRRVWYGRWLLVSCLWLAVAPMASATEGGGGLYLLGSQSLDAGKMPAPGWYATAMALQYTGSAGGASVGGVKLVSLDKRIDSVGANLLFAPRTQVLGGHLALSVTVPYAYLRLSGELSGARVVSRSVSGDGLGDVAVGARLGWGEGASFAHAVTLAVWAPTGNYTRGFNPSTGRDHWAGDASWSFTYAPGGHHTEFSAAIGVGINGPNTATHYRSGTEAHLELAVGQHVSAHWELGLAGYAYRQVSGDTGTGALLGSLKGRVYGIGPAANYGTRWAGHVFVFAARYYREFDAEHHFEGSLGMVSMTMRL